MSTLTLSRAKRSERSHSPRRNADYIRAGLWIALFVAMLAWAMPLVFVIFTSLKSEDQIFSTSSFSFPSSAEWANYAKALQTGNLLTAGGNSLLIALIKVPIGLLISAAAAFALSRIKFKYSRALLAAFAMGSMVPIQVALGPLFRVILDLGLLNNPIGVILPYIGFGLPYQIFILYGFFSAVPKEIDESVRVDGGGNWRLFLQIILPLSKPALAALFILDFVSTWNEYAIALVILQNKASQTVPLAIQGFQSQFTSSYGPLNAFTIMSILPVVIIYLLFQRYFVQGTFTGAVKG
ncbi:carbohydrate ABC transporter permease [Arthrobacter sp. MMS18-M83]|uniref:carbohydrate ABC transporter permease n=1 Tax=Arthrobacter sp. MMS18-M83 TaxID=2996261 RepID=UPI00227A9245|nr:carbohydrate ABC transporter permease [Arthrobacter sp. MMS18-M83]WAH98535.1 carbohydrate ABC transporter permease [Arthrobacter sp. MMS18-M83]